MEDHLLIGKFGNLVVQVNQEVLQIFSVGHEKSEVVVRLLESDCRHNLQIFDISVQRLEQCAFLGIEHIVSLLASNDLTDRMRSNQELDNFNRLFGYKLHKLLTELNDILLLLFEGNPNPNVFESFFIILFIFDQYFEVKFVLGFLFSQLHRLFVVGEVLADFDGSLYIKKIAFE